MIRRRYIVSSGFQGRFVLYFVSVALAGSVIATVLFNYFAAKRLEALQWSVFVTARSAIEALESLFLYINLFDLIFISALLIMTGALMMRMINAPLNRIIKSLKQITEGDLSSAIILRRNDEFKDVAASLNEMLNETRERFREFKSRHEEVSHALVELEIAHAKGIPVKEKEEQIINMIRKLRAKLNDSSMKKG